MSAPAPCSRQVGAHSGGTSSSARPAPPGACPPPAIRSLATQGPICEGAAVDGRGAARASGFIVPVQGSCTCTAPVAVGAAPGFRSSGMRLPGRSGPPRAARRASRGPGPALGRGPRNAETEIGVWLGEGRVGHDALVLSWSGNRPVPPGWPVGRRPVWSCRRRLPSPVGGGENWSHAVPHGTSSLRQFPFPDQPLEESVVVAPAAARTSP